MLVLPSSLKKPCELHQRLSLILIIPTAGINPIRAEHKSSCHVCARHRGFSSFLRAPLSQSLAAFPPVGSRVLQEGPPSSSSPFVPLGSGGATWERLELQVNPTQADSSLEERELGASSRA